MTGLHQRSDPKREAGAAEKQPSHQDFELPVQDAGPLSIRRAIDDPSRTPPAALLALQQRVGNQAVGRLLAGERPLQRARSVEARVKISPAPGPAVQRMKYEMTASAGTGDHFTRTFKVGKLTVKISSGHGYRPQHRPGGPDVTKAGTMDEIEEAILADLESHLNATSDTPPAKSKLERQVTVNGNTITYRAFSQGTGFVGVGTYFLP